MALSGTSCAAAKHESTSHGLLAQHTSDSAMYSGYDLARQYLGLHPAYCRQRTRHHSRQIDPLVQADALILPAYREGSKALLGASRHTQRFAIFLGVS
jgi:hypothetical protein